MMLNLISFVHGKDIAATVAAQVLHARVRSSVEPQASVTIRTGTRNKYLLQAIALMENQIDDRLEIESIAQTVGCSRRQLERLFSSKLGAAPMTYYRNICLDRARQLLSETRLSHREVAVACGFESSAARLMSRLSSQGIAAKLGFLFAVFENREDHSQSIYYRGETEHGGSGKAKLLPFEELPWDKFSDDATRSMLKRYGEERLQGRYKIYAGDHISGDVREVAEQ